MTNNDWQREFPKLSESGWPLCPSCGQDELWSDYNPYDGRGNLVRPKSVEAKILGGRVRCYVCSFERKPAASPQTQDGVPAPSH